MGELELAIPRLPRGSYFPSFLEPRRRVEQALVAVVQEAYVNGISTRKVDRLVEQLGLRSVTKDIGPAGWRPWPTALIGPAAAPTRCRPRSRPACASYADAILSGVSAAWPTS